MVNPVTFDSAANGQARTNSASNQLSGDFTQFLTLLTTQLQNQDPLSPMETNEFTQQLIGFSQVEQQINLNSKMDSMVALQLGNNMGAALSYVGEDVSYVSSEAYFDGARPVDITYAYNGTPISAKLRIKDDAGNIVYEANAAKTAGKNKFTWDGKGTDGKILPPGTYTVQIDALDANNTAVTNTTVVTGKVKGVETQNGLTYLLIGDRAVSLGNVLNVQSSNSTSNGTQEGIGSAISYIGREIKYKNSDMDYDGTNSVTKTYEFDEVPANAKVVVKDANGKIIYSTSASKGLTGNEFTRNGTKTDGTKAAAGKYTLSLEASDNNKNAINGTFYTSGIVKTVENKAGTIYLDVLDRKVKLGDVISVRDPIIT